MLVPAYTGTHGCPRPCACVCACTWSVYLSGPAQGPVQWQVLREDRSRRGTRHALRKDSFPGSLLIRLGLGRAERAVQTAGAGDTWAPSTAMPPPADLRPHHIRVYIYQVPPACKSVRACLYPTHTPTHAYSGYSVCIKKTDNYRVFIRTE